MERAPLSFKTKISINIGWICAFSIVAGLGWIFLGYFIGKLNQDNCLLSVLSNVIIEIAKTVFIASTLGVAFHFFLSKSVEKPDDTRVEEFSIKCIYPNRVAAVDKFLKQIDDRRTKLILIAGISLRDFLTGGGSLHPLWQKMRERLQVEETKNLTKNNRLHIKLLLLDPISGAGKYRANIEKNTIGAVGLEFDIPTAIDQVDVVKKSIYKVENTDFIEMRLYEHCPFSFLFVTEHSAIVEQYCYRDHSKPSMPLIEYDCNSNSHIQLQYSFKEIWQGSRPAKLQKYFVGFADGIQNSKIINIFRHDKRDVLGGRQIESIKLAKELKLNKLYLIRFLLVLFCSSIVPDNHRK